MTQFNYVWEIESRQVQHVTTACVTIVTKEGGVKTYCSDAIYGNCHYLRDSEDRVIYPTADVRVQGARREGICSMDSYCFHQGFTGTPSMPKCHSEIAAMEDLFSIPGEQTAKNWAAHISDFFPEKNKGAKRKLTFVDGNIKGIYVSLYNSRLAPCEPGRQRHSRVPCKLFLADVAKMVNAQVSQYGCSFGIRVRYPDGIATFGRLDQPEPRYREVNGAEEERNVFRRRSQRRRRRYDVTNYGEMTGIDVNMAVLFAFMLGF